MKLVNLINCLKMMKIYVKYQCNEMSRQPFQRRVVRKKKNEK